MSYKDFSQLNAAVSQYRLHPNYAVISRILNEVSEFSSIAKSIPVDWARAYAGVMVLKYASDGTPTDVTDTVTVNGVNAPDSLIADLKRRFYDVYNRYSQDKSLLSRQYPVTFNIKPMVLAPESSGEVLLMKCPLGSSGKALDVGHSDEGYWFRVNNTEVNPQKFIDNTACFGSFSIKSDPDSNTYRILFNLCLKYGTNNRQLTSECVITLNQDSGHTYSLNHNSALSNLNVGASTWGYYSYLVQTDYNEKKWIYTWTSTNINGSSNMQGDFSTTSNFDLDNIFLENDAAISDLKSAIDNL